MIPTDYKLPEGCVLVLRCVKEDGTSRANNDKYGADAPPFVWPESGPVEAPDWDPVPECGNGLHGWLWGVGNLSTCSYWDHEGTTWRAVEVRADEVLDRKDKVKFPRGVVVASGDRASVATFVVGYAPRDRPVMFAQATAGNAGTATAGDRGTATAGNAGTATAGDRGTATAGDRGTATAGYGGTATAGDRGTLVLTWWDGNRYRKAIGYAGEDGIEADVPYVVVDGKLCKKSPTETEREKQG